MFGQVVSLFFLRNINCFFTELRDVLEPSGWETASAVEINPDNFYWFGVGNRICLVYFNNRLKHHRNPYLLFLTVPGVRSEDWCSSETYQLLVSAFDNFYKTSAFLSLLPNQQNTGYYRFSAMIGDVWTGNKTTFVGKNFVLKSFTGCVSLLVAVEIGTKAWRRFYKVKECFYGLFVETYYVSYHNLFGNARTNVLFKTADLIEMSFIKFWTELVGTEVFLAGKENFFKIDPKKDTFLYAHNLYAFKTSWSERYTAGQTFRTTRFYVFKTFIHVKKNYFLF